jgi:preprotein translocase subunit YajC
MYWFLAQEAPADVPFWGHPIFLMVIIFGLMWFMFIRPQRKQEASRRAMIAGVRKNDRIVTTGGILGVVTNVKEQDEEVTIKIDEARDVKVRVLRNNIAAVLNRKDEA